MRPHLFKRAGLWLCIDANPENPSKAGYGYTPREAYDEFMRINNRAAAVPAANT